MSQKICIISFDHWNYDKHIVTALQKKGIESFHIKIGSFKHANWIERIKNTFSKIFLNKNPKIKRRQDYILNKLKERGSQDQILVINPEIIDLNYHKEIKSYTKKYIAYLYDSVDRNPVGHLLDGLFDEIYSFDKNDIEKYGFKETTNYNYLGYFPSEESNIKNDVLYIASFDKRLTKVLLIKNALVKIKSSFRLIIVGKKTTIFKLKNLFNNRYKQIELIRKRINQKDLKKLYSETRVVIDIVRENQTGLSFRVFEAMALEKKLITNNQSIKKYSFYNPNNILVIENENYNFNPEFIYSKYEPLPEHIFNEYTIDNWVSKIFNL